MPYSFRRTGSLNARINSPGGFRSRPIPSGAGLIVDRRSLICSDVNPQEGRESIKLDDDPPATYHWVFFTLKD
jgi:hypothetical protein